MERPYHDHGDWSGPCSDARHALLLAGGPPDGPGAKPRTAAERAGYTLDDTRISPEGLRCACCKTVLLADWGRIQELQDDAARGL